MKIINNIFENISFKINPDENIKKNFGYKVKKKIFNILGRKRNFEFSNLILKNHSEDDEKLKNILMKIEGMSSFANGYIINQICKSLGPNCNYVNIGVWKGFSLIAGMIDTRCNVYGVDNFSEFKGPKKDFLNAYNKFKDSEKHFFYELDYKIFFEEFEKLNKKIDFYFYDGEHSYQNQFDNLIIAKKFFKKDTLILVDDINFNDVENATKDFIKKFKGEFEILKEAKTANNNCHPTFWNGLIIFKKL